MKRVFAAPLVACLLLPVSRAHAEPEYCVGGFALVVATPPLQIDSKNPWPCWRDQAREEHITDAAQVTTDAGTQLTASFFGATDGNRLRARADVYSTASPGELPYWSGEMGSAGWATVRDRLLITSSTLPTGTAVDIDVTWQVEYTTNANSCGYDGVNWSPALVGAEFVSGEVRSVLRCDGQTSDSFLIPATVGEAVEIYYWLQVNRNLLVAPGESASGTTDASHTAALTLVPRGDVVLQSALGISYAPPPPYRVLSLFDEERAYRAGSTLPIKLRLLNGTANVSSASLPLIATGVRLKSTKTDDWGQPDDPGQSSPDRTFKYTMVDGDPGYRFNLKTTGLAPGIYELRFTVGVGGPALGVEFQIR